MELNGATVLNIEDTEAIRTFIEISLEAEGARFIGTGSSRQGLDVLQKDQPDLIVLDLGLPDIDGLTLLKDIKSQSDAKIVILTARRESHFRDMAIQRGADAYLTKPFMMQELLNIIQEL